MGGAMENWGLVTFRESAMLFDPATGSAADQKLVAMIVNHEFAHQVESHPFIPVTITKLCPAVELVFSKYGRANVSVFMPL